MNRKLQTLLDQKSVPSTLLLIGSDISNEALTFAQQLLNISKDPHPDIHHLLPEGKARLHPMEAIQQLLQEVALPPFEAPYKVFIIHDAECMAPSSANALLKTLEEPPADTHFLLLTSNPRAILPTILSRAQPIQLNTSSEIKEDDPAHTLLLEILRSNPPYPILLAQLSDLEKLIEEDYIPKAEGLLGTLLHFYRDKGNLTKLFPLVEKGREALYRNIKLKIILEYFFLAA